MYRTGDPRFRRRLNEIESTLERANETAQSSIYIFGQTYIRPCFESVASYLNTCVEASCPCLDPPRNRLRRQRAKSRGQTQPELSFDFYDDWEEDESDALLGWGNDESDHVADAPLDYGAITATQPGLQKKMSYGSGRRKGTGLTHGVTTDPAGPSLLGKLFGGRGLRYAPSAAGLQDHPGTVRKSRRGNDPDFDSAPSDSQPDDGRHGRARSGTSSSGQTTDSYSSRGDIFPSDDENDAIPLDDEFAMVLERRTTQSGDVSGTDGEDKSTQVSAHITVSKRGNRSSMGTRQSSRRTVSTRSTTSNGVDINHEIECPSRYNEDDQALLTEGVENQALMGTADIKLEERQNDRGHDGEDVR